MKNQTTNPRTGERGTALIVSMLLMMTLSMIGASLMFLAQTETASSISYRTMSQARYGAEAGIHKAANHLLYTYNATVPGTANGGVLTDFDMTTSPVKYNNLPVILSSNPSVASNYPVPAVQTAFNNAVQGTLAAGGVTVSYNASAKLLSMTPIKTYAGTSTVVQTWEITADGTIGGVHTATVEVVSTLEQPIVPAVSNAAFATGGGCGALSFGGNEVINSYVLDVAGNPVYSNSGGNVGTNGNMTLVGQATINGTLSTPRTGVGGCANGNVTALTESGQATVTNGLVQLPQTVDLETPPPPNPLPPTTTTSFTKNSGCDGAASCTVKNDLTTGYLDVATLTGGTTAATAVSLGNVKVSTQGTLHLKGGATTVDTLYYTFNSLSVSSGASIIVDGPGRVVVNIAGVGESTPIDFTGGSISNTGLNPAMLQLVYGGTGNIQLNGGAKTAMVIYAPNATASFQSNPGNFYGSVIANTISSNGAQIHYDRNLANDFFTSGKYMMTSFTWKKY